MLCTQAPRNRPSGIKTIPLSRSSPPGPNGLRSHSLDPRGSLAAASDTEPLQNLVHMILDGRRPDLESARDLLVGQPLVDEREHLAFSPREGWGDHRGSGHAAAESRGYCGRAQKVATERADQRADEVANGRVLGDEPDTPDAGKRDDITLIVGDAERDGSDVRDRAMKPFRNSDDTRCGHVEERDVGMRIPGQVDGGVTYVACACDAYTAVARKALDQRVAHATHIGEEQRSHARIRGACAHEPVSQTWVSGGLPVYTRTYIWSITTTYRARVLWYTPCTKGSVMHHSVRLASGILAASSLACSSSVSPSTDVSTVERAVSPAPAAIPYIPSVHVSALPAFDDPALMPTAFNDFGEVVGDSNNASTFTSTVFKWQSTRGFHFLHLPVDSFAEANAVSVNDHGQVAVELLTIPPTGRTQTIAAAIWDWFGNVRILRPLGAGYNCQPSSINDSGVLVGTCSVYPTVWTAFGTPDGLHVGGGGQPIQGSAYSISEAGYIAGQSTAAGYVFTPTKQLIPLPPPKASIPNRINTGINDSGWVAGQVFDTTLLHYDPAVWTRRDSLHVLYRAAGSEGNMTAISDDGIAVGAVTDATTGLMVPVIWTAAHGLQRLPGLERSTLLVKEAGAAIAINRVHRILGYIVLSTGQVRWVVWTLPAL